MKTYYANVGFWDFQSGTIPITAGNEADARAILMKMLQDKKDIEVFSLFAEEDIAKAPAKKNVEPPKFGLDA